MGSQRNGRVGIGRNEDDDEFPEASPARPVSQKVHAAIKAMVRDLKSDFPQTSVMHLMNAPDKPLLYNDVHIGRPGMCLDLNILGKCTTACGHRHGETNVTDDRAREVVEKLRPAVAAYKARRRGGGSTSAPREAERKTGPQSSSSDRRAAAG